MRHILAYATGTVDVDVDAVADAVTITVALLTHWLIHHQCCANQAVCQIKIMIAPNSTKSITLNGD